MWCWFHSKYALKLRNLHRKSDKDIFEATEVREDDDAFVSLCMQSTGGVVTYGVV